MRWWAMMALVVWGCGDETTRPDAALDATADIASDDVDDADDVAVTDASPDATTPPPARCLGPTGGAGASLSDPLGAASATVLDPTACRRSFTLTSSAVRRDDLPASPRVVVEAEDQPSLRSGNDLFDALHALALDEVRECSVERIADGAFDSGREQDCGEGGCFETGRKWTWVWTRDTSYSIDLALGALDPTRAKNSLLFKLSARRDGQGAAGELQIVQDTGSGGSWPVSSDRVVWALGAEAVLAALDGDAYTTFRDTAWQALQSTLEADRRVVFDATTGLYSGEQSFLDWREQTYPSWTSQDVVDIATSRSLSTNLLHLHALRLAFRLAGEVGAEAQKTRYAGWADALEGDIRRHFWRADDGLFATFLPSFLDAAPARRADLLGTALAILGRVATPAEAQQMLARYPGYGPALPVIWPQQQQVAIYHNRAEWPFVDAYALRAAKLADHAAIGTRLAQALVRGAALNLSNMENLEAGSGAPWLDDGPFAGPVVNSQRQLWSVAGYLAMVHDVLFGLRPTAEGLGVRPWLPRALREALFPASEQVVLNDWPYRGRRVTVVLNLPAPDASASGTVYRASRLRLDGQDVALVADQALLRPDALGANTLVEVDMAIDPASQALAEDRRDPTDWRAVFGPRTPLISSIEAAEGKLALTLKGNDDDPSGITFDLYRDGVRVAHDLPATTTRWVDPDSDASRASSPCYVAEAVFTSSGNRSQRSRVRCWWGAESAAIQVIDANRFVAIGGTGVTEYGRFHYQGWGEPGHRLDILDLAATRSGPHLFQVTYGNGAGPISTGIGCGVKRLVVKERASGTIVADGMLVMPQLGRWDRWSLSSFVPATLEAGKRYDVSMQSDPAAFNMTALERFATYRGATGGVDGPFNRVNIADLRVLAR